MVNGNALRHNDQLTRIANALERIADTIAPEEGG